MARQSNGALSWRVLPWVLLVLSLALNVFFVGGNVYTRMLVERVEKSPGERARIVARRLALDTRQREAFGDLRAKIRSRSQKYRAASRGSAARIWAEIAKDRPNKRVIERNLRTLSKNRLAFQTQASAIAIDFLARLDSEQKKLFLALAKQRNFLGSRLLRKPKGGNAPVQSDGNR
ncbi:MAG: periplasmic heavy metal sensor [Alphaproteobacteria bacterium]